MTVMAEQCPQCGAPVDLSHGPITCQYCGAHVEEVKPTPPPPPVVPPPASITFPHPPHAAPAHPRPHTPHPPIKKKRNVGSIIGAVIGVVVGGGGLIGGIVAVLYSPGAPLASPRYAFNGTPFAISAPASAPAGSPSDLLVSATLTDSGGKPGLLYLAGGTKKRWTLTGTKADGLANAYVGDATHVFLANNDTLRAVDRLTGKDVWKVQVPSPLDTRSCTSCLVTTAGRVVELGSDGTVQAFDATTGSSAWVGHVTEGAKEMHLYGSSVGIVSDPADAAAPQAPDAPDAPAVGPKLAVFDGATGAMHAIAPTCADQAGEPPEPAAEDGFFGATADGAGLIVGYRSCLQRYDVATGKVVWQQLQDPAHPTVPDDALVATPNELFAWSADGHLAMYDPATGAPTAFTFDKRYTITPVGFTDGTAIILATPSFGDTRSIVWGLKASAPTAPAWQHKLLEPDLDRGDVAVLSNGAVGIIDCTSDPEQCTFSSLAAADGHVVGQAKKTYFIASVDGTRSSGTRMIAVVDGRLAVFDAAAGKIVLSLGS